MELHHSPIPKGVQVTMLFIDAALPAPAAPERQLLDRRTFPGDRRQGPLLDMHRNRRGRQCHRLPRPRQKHVV